MAQNYQNLIVWQKAIELTVCIYTLTQAFPKSELYGLTSQMRRASISVASNIAEGRGTLNTAEFRQFVGIAQGSVFELRTQILVAKSLGFAAGEVLTQAKVLSNEVSRMLTTFIQRLALQSRNQVNRPACMRRTNELTANSQKLTA
ncbi:MAG TPA: four helix bundle protein [Terracidiphilus sp.]|nr:four helix bundle protein [Terracidiphilus sp.]